MRALIRVVAATTLFCTLSTQPGCTCVIDPCPVLVQRDYTWSIGGRVASLVEYDASRISFSTSERVALVDAADGDTLRLSELLSYNVGQQLGGGGRLVARFQGGYTLDLDSTPVGRLVVVRLEPGVASLGLAATVEWDIEDCATPYVSDPYLTDLEPACGDGIVEAPELCDDENAESGDGCSDCLVDAGGCAGEPGEAWSYWTCEWEPSLCEPHHCDDGSADPSCSLVVALDVDVVTEGRVLPGDAPGTIGSEPPGVECSCTETAIRYECSAACAIQAAPCTSLAAAGSAAIAFERWADGCDGADLCTVRAGAGHVIGVFESAVTGLERERRYVAYPLSSSGLDLPLMGSGGGLVVAAGAISGELEDPTAPEVPPGQEPRPFVLALDEQLELVWARDVPAGDGGTFGLMDVAVDAAGNTVLVGRLFGTLELENGAVTVESLEHPESTPRQLVLVAFSRAGEHLWSTLVALPVPYDVIGAQLDAADDGALGLAAVIDINFFEDDAVTDLVVASVSPAGNVSWVRRLRHEEGAAAELAVESVLSTAIDESGNVTVAGGASGEGPFGLELPEPAEPGGPRRFVVALSAEGAERWSDPLPPADSFDAQLVVDASGRVSVLTATHLITYTADGQIRWARELSPRAFDANPYATAPTRGLAVDAASGELVLSIETSTLALAVGAEEHFAATVTSRLSLEGEPLWTVRRGSLGADGEVFLNRAVSVAGDQVFVLGAQFVAGGPRNDAAVVRRIVDSW